jgi:hypothetical protein
MHEFLEDGLTLDGAILIPFIHQIRNFGLLLNGCCPSEDSMDCESRWTMQELGHEGTRDFGLINCLESHDFGNLPAQGTSSSEFAQNTPFWSGMELESRGRDRGSGWQRRAANSVAPEVDFNAYRRWNGLVFETGWLKSIRFARYGGNYLRKLHGEQEANFPVYG